MKQSYDAIIIGAGAAGLMCAQTAGQRGRRVLLIDHAKKIGEKIRISGGGRCNFTNLHTFPQNYLSHNPHFCKSALKQFTPQDFINLIKAHKIAYHEKKLGQLFCDHSAQDIIDMLQARCRNNGVTLSTGTTVTNITYSEGCYHLETSAGLFQAPSLVVATGGLSIPKIGATKLGYMIAQQFQVNLLPTRPALVPLTFQADLLQICSELSGLSIDAVVSCGTMSFSEGLLFTHRGLSGPSILQISSYWQEGQSIHLNLKPDLDVKDYLKEQKTAHSKQDIKTAISRILPARLAEKLCQLHGLHGRLAELSDKSLSEIGYAINNWEIKPSGTEGYRTAEVTLGGVDTQELSSKTMETTKQPGLYFIGEVVDVTGHLGGFNFQWAWSSGFAAGQNL